MHQSIKLSIVMYIFLFEYQYHCIHIQFSDILLKQKKEEAQIASQVLMQICASMFRGVNDERELVMIRPAFVKTLPDGALEAGTASMAFAMRARVSALEP